jgi:2-iminobutanoate/2-iminopropanoate deaminase
MFKVIETSNAPVPVGPYSQAVALGPLLFCSGQIAIDPKTNEVQKGSVGEQTHLVMKNITAVLGHAGLSLNSVVKTTIFLSDMSSFSQVNEVYSGYFKPPYPARSCVAVKELPKGVDVEIEVIAYKGEV